MRISARTRANRKNAKKSSGPHTLAGKAKVAGNARQHGLSGSFSILAHEDAAEFQKLLDDYKTEFKPETTDESFLVEQMAQSRWTLARARRIESHLLNQLAGQPAEPGSADARIAAELLDRSPSAPATIQRYATTAERSYFRARRELQQAHSRELRNKANEAQLWLKQQLSAPVPVDRRDLDWIASGNDPAPRQHTAAPATNSMSVPAIQDPLLRE